MESALVPLEAEQALAPPTIGGKVTVGANFEADRLPGNGFIPPDTMGAVGPRHIVLFINGRFRVFDKSTQAVLETRTLNDFWRNKVGLGPFNAGRVFDPRIIYDPVNEIFFASAIDDDIDADGDGATDTPNNIYVARSDTNDPTGVWRGFSFPGDTPADGNGLPEFHDYPTLGMNADGIYICTQDFGDVGNQDESCYSLPKADVMANPPTAANLTRFVDTPPGLASISGSWQPVVDHGLSLGRNALVGSDGSNLSRTDIANATGPGALLGTVVAISADPGHGAPPAARQPDDGTDADEERIENVAPRFVGNLVVVDGDIWGVHAVLGTAGNSALRWYRIGEATNSVLDGGLIEDVTRDFHEPSIAVNEFGQVVIGYTCSGPNLPASACASVGEIDTGTGLVEFEPPAILHVGIGTYWVDFCNDPVLDGCSERNRWGDYSATVVDPIDACTFWTFQEYTAVGGMAPLGPSTHTDGGGDGGAWGVRITQLTYDGCAGGDVAVTKICKPDNGLLAGEEGFCRIFVDNLSDAAAAQGVKVVDALISDGTFAIGTVTTTAGTCTSTANPQIQSGRVDCDVGWLEAGDRVEIVVPISVAEDTPQTVNDVVTLSTESPDPDKTNNQDEGTLWFRAVPEPEADLIVTKICKPDHPALVGTEAQCTIYVDNFGPASAENVVLIDEMLANPGVSITLGSIAQSQGTCNGNEAANEATIDCDLGALSLGDRVTVTYTLGVDLPADVNNVATVKSDTADPDNNDNQAAESVTFNFGTADLFVKKICDTDPVQWDTETARCTIIVKNLNGQTATNVMVSDKLTPINQLGVVEPAVEIVEPVPAGCVVASAAEPSIVECGLGDLAPGDQRELILDLKANEPTDAENTVLISSDADDPDTSNNETQASLSFVGDAVDLTVTKTDSIKKKDSCSWWWLCKSSGGDPDWEVTYTVRVDNKGPDTAEGVLVTDHLPAETDAVLSATFETKTKSFWFWKTTVHKCNVNGQVVTCDIGTLAANGTREIVIKISVEKTPVGTVLSPNVATVESDTGELIPSDNTFNLMTTLN